MIWAILWPSNIPSLSIHQAPVVPVNYREIWILSTPRCRYLHYLRFTLGLNEFLIKQNCYLISRGPSVRTIDKLPLIIYFPVLWPLDVGNDVRINNADKHQAPSHGEKTSASKNNFYSSVDPPPSSCPGWWRNLLTLKSMGVLTASLLIRPEEKRNVVRI